MPYDFTGCLARLDITYQLETFAILRIVGCTTHNEACTKAVMKHLPAIPLHDHVWQIALDQLIDGAR